MSGKNIDTITILTSEINYLKPFINNTTQVCAIIMGKPFDFLVKESYEEIKDQIKDSSGFEKYKIS